MNAKNISTELKAAYLVGLFAGTNAARQTRHMQEYRKALFPHAVTAMQIVYEGGAFNPISIYEMEKFYDRIVDESTRQAEQNAATGDSSFDDVLAS